MSNRITDAMLEARVDTVNELLGNDPEAPYSTVGVVTLGKAYGGVSVQRYCNRLGGISMLTDGHGTKREALIFLNGMISALRPFNFTE